MNAGTLTYETKLNTDKFQKGINDISGKVKSGGTKVKSIIAALGITKIISTAIGQITQSIDGAISRYDTLNNFPKVMSNLGIASDEAQKSISKMSDKLAGLPTTLDQGASAVQRFTSKNGDVEKSTDLFLALNNAILAGGAPMDQQASALEQLSQAYAKGKPDMLEWRTAMTAMPAQLKQVAEAMGYVNADELGEALRTGAVSMDDFMDTIVRLNEEGVEGFANFETQARNSTGGIGTAITVAKTQIVKGVTDIIDALNVKFQELGFGTLSDMIANVGKKSKEALDVIAKLIKGEMSVKEVVDLAGNLVMNFLTKINESLPSIIETGGKVLSDLMTGMTEKIPELMNIAFSIMETLITSISQQLPTLIPQAVKVIITIAEGLINNLDKIVNAAIELIMGLAIGLIDAIPILIDAVPQLIDALVTKLTDTAMIQKIMEAALLLIIKLVEGIIKSLPKLKEAGDKIISSLINGIISLVNNVRQAGINILTNFINGLGNKMGGVKDKAREIVNNIINTIAGLGSQMYNWGRDMIQGLINGIKSMISKVTSAVKGVANSIKSFLHFSRPDEGPLRDYETWMPDMMEGLAKSMRASSGILEDETERLANKVKDAFNIEAGQMSFSGTTGSVSQILSANAQFEGTIPLRVDLDGEKIYDNQQKITARKSLQYGGVK